MSGKEVEALGLKEKKRKESTVEVEVERESEEERPAEAMPTHCSESLVHCSERCKSRGISFPDNPPIISPSLPFPQRFQKKKLDTQFAKCLEIFKKIHISIPFVDALEQMPNYAKFMKELTAKKRKLEDYETVK